MNKYVCGRQDRSVGTLQPIRMRPASPSLPYPPPPSRHLPCPGTKSIAVRSYGASPVRGRAHAPPPDPLPSPQVPGDPPHRDSDTSKHGRPDPAGEPGRPFMHRTGGFDIACRPVTVRRSAGLHRTPPVPQAAHAGADPDHAPALAGGAPVRSSPDPDRREDRSACDRGADQTAACGSRPVVRIRSYPPAPDQIHARQRIAAGLAAGPQGLTGGGGGRRGGRTIRTSR